MDRTNVGDWWSHPARYFPLRDRPTYNITDYSPAPDDRDIHIVGGGGLGTPYFRPHLQRLLPERRRFPLIAWGVGVDTLYGDGGLLDRHGDYDLTGDFFDAFDEVGTRVHDPHSPHRWVPCVSCMHPAFFELRASRPQRRLGIYQHKGFALAGDDPQSCEVMDNAGDEILPKLQFLARHEAIVTNTYHGVYWATLLCRKVVCLPIKSGLFSFRHPPAYSTTGLVDTELIDSAPLYPNALEECRRANIDYYQYLRGKFGEL